MAKLMTSPVLQKDLQEDTVINQGAHFLHVLPHIISKKVLL